MEHPYKVGCMDVFDCTDCRDHSHRLREELPFMWFGDKGLLLSAAVGKEEEQRQGAH